MDRNQAMADWAGDMAMQAYHARSDVAMYRKAEQPALGPAFDYNARGLDLLELPGGSVIGFNLEMLTLADYRAMRSHPQINASLSLMTFMLHQQDWHIECEDKKVAALVEENLRLIWTRLIRAVGQAFWAGYSPCVLEWENVQNGTATFITKVKDLLPEDCEVNWLEVESSYRPPNQQPGQIVPKVKVFDGIKKFGLNYPIPPDHSFWYPMLMENGGYYGRKLLKPAFMPWYFSIMIHMFSNRYFERFGEPLPIGRAPFEDEFTVKNPDGTDKTITGKQAMEAIMMNLRNRGVVVLPSQRDDSASGAGGRSEFMYDIEYLESQMRGADFERYMARLDEEMSLAIFTPTLLMRSADVGSHNLGVQHTQTWLWSLNALAGDLKEYIDRYICERIKAINFTPNAPRCEWVPRPMGKDNPETLRAIIAGLIGGGGVKVDLDELGTALGLSLKEVKILSNPNDPADPNAPDTRDRSERARGQDGTPRKVGEPLATGTQITARVRQQVEKAWNSDRFGEGMALSFGYRRRMTESFVAEGWEPAAAESLVDGLYHRLDGWAKTISSLGTDEFSSADEFMKLFERKLTTEIERHAGN